MKRLILFLLLPGSLAIAAVIGNAPEKIERDYDGIGVEKLHVENTSGRINITVGDRPRVVITATKTNFPEKCTFTTEKTEFLEVIVRVERPVGQDCQVDLDISVPKQIALNLWSGSGRIDVNGTEGNLSFNTGAGAVVANGQFAKVEGKSGSGNVTINGIAGGGSVSVGSGDVNLKFNEDPTGNFDVKTGNGDALLNFPRGSKIKADLGAGSGQVENEIQTSDSADFGISVKTGSGDLKVKAYE
jgi:hypothetical protein